MTTEHEPEVRTKVFQDLVGAARGVLRALQDDSPRTVAAANKELQAKLLLAMDTMEQLKIRPLVGSHGGFLGREASSVAFALWTLLTLGDGDGDEVTWDDGFGFRRPWDGCTFCNQPMKDVGGDRSRARVRVRARARPRARAGGGVVAVAGTGAGDGDGFGFGDGVGDGGGDGEGFCESVLTPWLWDKVKKDEATRSLGVAMVKCPVIVAAAMGAACTAGSTKFLKFQVMGSGTESDVDLDPPCVSFRVGRGGGTRSPVLFCDSCCEPLGSAWATLLRTAVVAGAEEDCKAIEGARSVHTVAEVSPELRKAIALVVKAVPRHGQLAKQVHFKAIDLKSQEKDTRGDVCWTDSYIPKSLDELLSGLGKHCQAINTNAGVPVSRKGDGPRHRG